jgi:hypothetical protein
MSETRDTTPTTVDLAEHAERYEALRGRALDLRHASTPREGLVVLLRHGMASWMGAWSTLPPPSTPTPSAPRKRPPLPDDVSAEVVRVLASMALSHLQEMHV